MITVITPTRGRPKNFAVLRECMESQTYGGQVRWLVVGEDHEGYDIPLWATQIKTAGVVPKGRPSLRQNLEAALDAAEGHIFLMEDDDWYHPEYLERMSKHSPGAAVLGVHRTPVYNVRTRQFKRANSAFLGNMRLRPDVAPTLRRAVHEGVKHPEGFIKKHFQGQVRFIGPATTDKRMLFVGLKGVSPDGITTAHPSLPGGRLDRDGVLERWVGEEWAQRLKRMCDE